MIIQDFQCQQCGQVIDDVPVESGTTELPCPACEDGIMIITFGGWTGLALVNGGRSIDDRESADGTISMLGIRDAHLAKVELGLANSPNDRMLRTFTPEQQQEFRKRIMIDGDGARKERKQLLDLLAIRKANLAAKRKGKPTQ